MGFHCERENFDFFSFTQQRKKKFFLKFERKGFFIKKVTLKINK